MLTFITVCTTLVFGTGLVIYARRRLRNITQSLWGTDTISEAAEQMKREYATTPKSVSAMTSLLLPKIIADFPQFHYDEMKERAENVLITYLHAITTHNGSLLTDGNSELKQQLENTLQMHAAQGKKEHFDQIRIHRTEISRYLHTAGRCTITFQTALECYHYITQDRSDQLEGSKAYKYQTRYNIDLIYIQDRNLVENDLDHALGLNCPNCGAPLSCLGAKICEYCGTPMIEYNIRTWTFGHIEEAI